MDTRQKLNFMERLRLKLYLLSSYSFENYLKSPSFIKNNEQAIKQVIDYECNSINDTKTGELLINWMVENPNKFSVEQIKNLIIFGLETCNRKILFFLNDHMEYYKLVREISTEAQITLFNMYDIKVDELVKYLKLCDKEVQVMYINNHPECLKYASDKVQIDFIKRGEYFEYIKYAQESVQKYFFEQDNNNLKYLSENIQLTILSDYPELFQCASIYVKNIIFSGNDNINILAKILKYNPANYKFFNLKKNEDIIYLMLENIDVFLDDFEKIIEHILRKDFRLDELSKEQIIRFITIDSNFIVLYFEKNLNDVDSCMSIFSELYGSEQLSYYEESIKLIFENEKIDLLKLLFNKDILNANSPDIINEYLQTMVKYGRVDEQFRQIIYNTYGEKALKILMERKELDIFAITSLEVFDSRILDNFSEEFVNDLISYNIKDFSLFLNIIKNDNDLELFKKYYSILSDVMGRNVETIQKAILEFYFNKSLLEQVNNVKLTEIQQINLISCLCSMENQYDISSLEELDNFDIISKNKMLEELEEAKAIYDVKEVISMNILGLKYAGDMVKRDYGDSVAFLVNIYGFDNELCGLDDEEYDLMNILNFIYKENDIEKLLYLGKKLACESGIRNPIALYSAIAKIKENQIDLLNRRLLTSQKLDDFCERERLNSNPKVRKEVIDGVTIYYMEGLDIAEEGTPIIRHVVNYNFSIYGADFMEYEKQDGISTVSATLTTDMFKLIAPNDGAYAPYLFSHINPEDLVVYRSTDALVSHLPKLVRSTSLGSDTKLSDNIYERRGYNEVAFYRRIRNHDRRALNNLDGRIMPSFIKVVSDGENRGSIADVPGYILEEARRYGIPIMVIKSKAYEKGGRLVWKEELEHGKNR